MYRISVDFAWSNSADQAILELTCRLIYEEGKQHNSVPSKNPIYIPQEVKATCYKSLVLPQLERTADAIFFDSFNKNI